MSARIKVSRAGIELIKAFEGFRRRAARLPDGRWTIGYGHTLSAREGAEVSEADAEALLIFDLMAVANAVEKLAETALNQNQFDALVAFAFNIGLEAFRGSSVLARVNLGQLTEAAIALEGWRETMLDGRSVVLDPLVRRRAAEKALFLTPPGGPFATPTPLIRPGFDVRIEAVVPSRGLADVEIPFDGPAADVRVIAMPEPEPEPEPTLQSAPEAEALAEIAAAAEPEVATVSEVVADLPTPPSGQPEPEPAPAPAPPEPTPQVASQPVSAARSAPLDRSGSAMRAFLYSPYAQLNSGPLPLRRASPPAPAPVPPEPASIAAPDPVARPAASSPHVVLPGPIATPIPVAPAASPTPQFARPAPAAPPVPPALPAPPAPATAPVIAAPLSLPPRPMEPRVFAQQPQPTSPPPTVLVAPSSTVRAAAELLVLTPPPEQDPTPGRFGARREPEVVTADDEPALFETDAVRIVRHEVIVEQETAEPASGTNGRWWLLAGVGFVACAGAMAAFLRQNDYSGRAPLAPETVAWVLAIVGMACFATAAYFLLKRLGGVRD